MKNVFKFFALSALLMSFALFAGSVFAQTTTTGSIEGTVTDPTGAAVLSLSVTTTRHCGLMTTATTNGEGFFRISLLDPGTYVVSVASEKGFAAFEQADVPVNLSRVSTMKVELRPKGATETVTVTA